MGQSYTNKNKNEQQFKEEHQQLYQKTKESITLTVRRVKRASARKRNGAAFAELSGLHIQSIIVAFIISDNSLN